MKKRYNYISCISFCTIVLLQGSCASIINGKKQTVNFQTNPTGAKVFINDKELGVTPLKLELERDHIHVVTFKLKGHEEYDLVITKDLSNWVWLNILLGGIVGIFVDDATGGAYLLIPESSTTELTPSEKSSITNIKGNAPLFAKQGTEWKEIGYITKRGVK
jgi:hypothetical protein